MASKKRKKVSKKTAKKTSNTARGSTRRGKTMKKARKRRTPAQVAATKRLVAANKARAKTGMKASKKTSKKVSKKTSRRKVIRHSPAYWTKWAANQQPTMTATGHMIHSGPMTPAQDAAARKALKAMGPRRKPRTYYTGKYFKAPRGKVYGPTRADYVGPILPKSHTRKTRSTSSGSRKSKAAKVRTVTANQIIGNATKASKFHKLAAWVCANPSGRRTGCGGGHVVGILR